MHDQSPVFIGNFRSGTTLVANLLGFHDDLAPWYETKALCEPLRWLRVLVRPECLARESGLVRPLSIPGFSAEAVAARMREDFYSTAARIDGVMISGKGAHEYYPLGHDRVAYSLEEVEAALDRWYDRVRRGSPDIVAIRAATAELILSLGALHAERSGRRLWVNKTPEIPRFASELRSCLGSCRIVMMMREREAVVGSAMKLGWGDAEEIASWWQGMIEESRKAAEEAPGDYFEMDYASLLRNPEAKLNELLGFIGVAEQGEILLQRYEASLPVGGRRLTVQRGQSL